MNLGYDKALYVLPFDHRQSYVTDMFHFKPPLDATQHEQVIDTKQVLVRFNAARAHRRRITFCPKRLP